MKNLVINKKLVSSLLLGQIILLSGCGAKSECNDNEYHLHKYEKNGIVRYMEDEYLKKDGFEWTEEKVYVKKSNEKLYSFEKKNGLIKIDDNIRYIKSKMNQNTNFLEYRYSYTSLVPIAHHVRTGKTSYTYYTYMPVTHHSWTTDENHSRLTGEVRECKYVYNAYNIDKNEKGKYKLLKSDDVDNVLEIKDKYPYMKEKFYKVIVISTGLEADYEDGKEENNQYAVNDEEEKYEKEESNKTLKKTN